jgi:DNA replication and repair protein RecF
LGNNYFFVRLNVRQTAAALNDDIQVGFSEEEGKVVRWNQKVITSHKELVSQFKVITLVADDIAMIQGEPEVRREFLNYAMILNDPSFLGRYKTYRQILSQRNSLLLAGGRVDDTFITWTRQLWDAAAVIRHQRQEYLRHLECVVNTLLTTYFVDDNQADFRVELSYITKGGADTENFETFWGKFAPTHAQTEWQWRRSLFGVHLDDVAIIFQGRRARIYASRGQQKLLAFLLKIAQLQPFSSEGQGRVEPGILLLDDFMTDFDKGRVERCLATLRHFDVQIFLSTPVDPRAFLNGFDDVTCHIHL